MITKLFQEAGFGSNVIKGLTLVANQINKRTSNNFKLSEISEPYSNKYGEFSGYNMFSGNKRLRFNITLGSSTSTIYSVDIWYTIREIPNRTLLLNGYNILQVLDEIVGAINGTLKEDERKTTDVSPARQRKVMTKREKLMAKYDVSSMDASDKYEQLKSYVKMVASGLKNSLIISGEAGLSKTSTVQKVMADSGVRYAWANVYIGTMNDLYKILYTDNKKVLVFDDTDYLIHRSKGKKFREILLSATELSKKRLLQLKDIKDKEIRSSNNPKGKYPQSFTYEGGLIFITNLDMKYVDPSLLSRSLTIDMRFSKYDILNMIKEGLKEYYPEVPMNIKKEVLNFLSDIIDISEKFDFRKYRDVLMLRMSGDPNWAKWAFSII